MRRWRWRRFAATRALAEPGEHFEVHLNQITQWKARLLECVPALFGSALAPSPNRDGERFFRRRAHQGEHAKRKAMIDPTREVSITRQAQLLGIRRAAVYCVLQPVSYADLQLQHHIGALHLERPFAGARTLKKLLRRRGSSPAVSASRGRLFGV
jgi:hypothetical protein